MRRIIRLALPVMAILMIIPPFAGATSALYISDGTAIGWIWVWDQDGNGWDTNPVAGIINYSGTLNYKGPWSITVSFTTRPAQGSVLAPDMDLAINAASSGPGSLMVRFGDVDFGPLSVGSSFESTMNGTTIGTVTYNTYLNTGNALWGTDTLLTTSTLGPGAFSVALNSGPASASAPYSLSQYVWITHSGAGTTNVGASLAAVPEPASFLLLGAGLAVIGLAARRRKR